MKKTSTPLISTLSGLLFIMFFTCSTAIAQSDSKSIEIAENVMTAMGGDEAWERTRYIKWTFFGRRDWIWNKWTGDIRCEVPESDTRIAMNIHSNQGEVYAHGQVQTHPDSVEKFLTFGFKAWINDSYWLVMPFKMQDPGVVLTYIGIKPDMDATDCDVVQMTFNEVGVTPDNKYHVYVDPSTSMITQWDYFSNFDDEEPRFSSPWKDYQEYGDIMLSSDRGNSKLDGISVHNHLPEALFKDVTKKASELK